MGNPLSSSVCGRTRQVCCVKINKRGQENLRASFGWVRSEVGDDGEVVEDEARKPGSRRRRKCGWPLRGIVFGEWFWGAAPPLSGFQRDEPSLLAPTSTGGTAALHQVEPRRSLRVGGRSAPRAKAIGVAMRLLWLALSISSKPDCG